MTFESWVPYDLSKPNSEAGQVGSSKRIASFLKNIANGDDILNGITLGISLVALRRVERLAFITR